MSFGKIEAEVGASVNKIVKSKYAVPLATTIPLIATTLIFGEKNKALSLGFMAATLGETMLLENQWKRGSSTVPHRPAGSIGGVPLTNITYEEVTHSDKHVKFRASGNSFFAHQIGDTLASTITIRGTLLGPRRFVTMDALESLAKMSKGKKKEVMSQGNALIPSDKPAGFDSKDDKTYTAHRTYSLILPETLMLNAFIESVQFSRRVENGENDSLDYTLLIRMYEPPPPSCVVDGVLKVALKYKLLSYSTLNTIMTSAYRYGNYLFDMGSKRFLLAMPRATSTTGETGRIDCDYENSTVNRTSETRSFSFNTNNGSGNRTITKQKKDMKVMVHNFYKWEETPTDILNWTNTAGDRREGIKVTIRPKTTTSGLYSGMSASCEQYKENSSGVFERTCKSTLTQGWEKYFPYTGMYVRCDILKPEELKGRTLPSGASIKIDYVAI